MLFLTVTFGDCSMRVPAKREVCPTCDGTGSHVNRSIDGNGLTAEDFEQDPDFRDSYMAGHYDVRCEQCKGANVVTVVDRNACDAHELAAVEQSEREEADAWREERSEARYFETCGDRY